MTKQDLKMSPEDFKQIKLADKFPLNDEGKFKQVLKDWQKAINKNPYDSNIFMSQSLLNFWTKNDLSSYLQAIQSYLNSYVPTFVGNNTGIKVPLIGFLVNIQHIININQFKEKKENLDPLDRIIKSLSQRKFCHITTYPKEGEQGTAKKVDMLLTNKIKKASQEDNQNNSNKIQADVLRIINEILLIKFGECSTVRGYTESYWSGGLFSLLCKNEFLCERLIVEHPLFNRWGKDVRFFQNEYTTLEAVPFREAFPSLTSVIEKYLKEFE